MKCPECNRKMTARGNYMTYVGYISPPGHDHDDNRKTYKFTCECGVVMYTFKQNKCPNPECAWVGRETS